MQTGIQKQLDELAYWNAMKLQTNKQAAAMTELINWKYQSIGVQLSGHETTYIRFQYRLCKVLEVQY